MPLARHQHSIRTATWRESHRFHKPIKGKRPRPKPTMKKIMDPDLGTKSYAQRSSSSRQPRTTWSKSSTVKNPRPKKRCWKRRGKPKSGWKMPKLRFGTKQRRLTASSGLPHQRTTKRSSRESRVSVGKLKMIATRSLSSWSPLNRSWPARKRPAAFHQRPRNPCETSCTK
ncbi:hypothetical protein BDR22DRAFT_842830 [Usnea florida]